MPTVRRSSSSSKRTSRSASPARSTTKKSAPRRTASLERKRPSKVELSPPSLDNRPARPLPPPNAAQALNVTPDEFLKTAEADIARGKKVLDGLDFQRAGAYRTPSRMSA